MQFFKKLWQQIGAYKQSFFTINQTELTTFSKLLMMLFFFTSLWLIAMGISSSIRQIETPQKKYGFACEKFVNAKEMTISDFQKKESRYTHRDLSFGTNEACQMLKKKYVSITQNHHIQSEIVQVRLLSDKEHQIESQQRRLHQQYSNMLLEKISQQESGKSILDANANNIKKKLDGLQKREDEIRGILQEKRNIMNYPLLQEFVSLLDKSKEGILSGLERERKYYRLKMSAQIFAFLIPIWLLFYLLYRFLHRRQKYIFAQLSFYVASAASLYGLVELVQLIYSVIPKIFLAKLIAFFTSYNMVIVLNVLAVLFFLVIFGLIIHKVQKNSEKQREKKDTRVLNVKQERCFACGSRRMPEDVYCSYCGEELKTKCQACDTEIYKYTLYCHQCGQKQS